MYFHLHKMMSKTEMHLPSTERFELLLHSFRTDFTEATQDRKQDNDTHLVQQQWLSFHSYCILYCAAASSYWNRNNGRVCWVIYSSVTYSWVTHSSAWVRQLNLPFCDQDVLTSQSTYNSNQKYSCLLLSFLRSSSWKVTLQLQNRSGKRSTGKQCNCQYEIMLTVSRCVRWCFARSLELLKAFWQPGCWHRYGFSPVWLRRWILRFSSLENALLHPSNWKTS